MTKLSIGFIILGVAFLGMLLMIFIVGFGTQNTIEEIGNSSLRETTDELNSIYTLVKFGSITKGIDINLILYFIKLFLSKYGYYCENQF